MTVDITRRLCSAFAGEARAFGLTGLPSTIHGCGCRPNSNTVRYEWGPTKLRGPAS